MKGDTTMRTFDEFTQEVKVRLEEELQHPMEIVKTDKINGSVTQIRYKDEVIGCAITLDAFYSKEMTWSKFDEIIEEIKGFFQADRPDIDVKKLIHDFANWETAKEHVIFQLVNAKWNSHLLHANGIKDLVMIFRYRINENASILISKEHIQKWNIGLKELRVVALENTQKLLPARIGEMLQFIGGNNFPLSQIHKIGMDDGLYILTNSQKTFGAGILLYDDVLETIAEHFGKSFYILPSSIHEVLILITSENVSMEFLNEMVQTVNDESVAPNEVLSERIYFYDCYTRTIK